MTNFAAFPYMGQNGYQTPQGAPEEPQFPTLPQGPFKAPDLPQAPPRKRGSLFDKDHRQETLLAIAAGFGSGSNFGEGASNMARNLLALKQGIRAEDRKDNTFGGPDNAFEITTDPSTGVRTVREVPEFAGYLEKKRLKAKDVADINGRAMSALLALPEDQRPAAYDHMRANAAQYGIDPSAMPAKYDPNYVSVTAGMGATVAQTMAANQRAQDAADREAYRKLVQGDRTRRTDIYEGRSAAATRQGDERIGLARRRESRVAAGPKKPKVSPGNLDLSYLLK